MHGFLRVAHLERYQHYRQRRPPWIKWHRCCLDDPEFCRLQDASKWLAIGLVLLASETGNRIPADAEWIRKRLMMHEPPNLKALVEVGFIEDASNALATCVQSASEVLASEIRDQSSEASEGIPAPEELPAGKLKQTSRTRVRKRDSGNGAMSPEFLALWELSPRRNGRRVGRAEAWREWQAQACQPIAAQILGAMRAEIASRKLAEDQEEWVAPPVDLHRWIRRRRFEDPAGPGSCIHCGWETEPGADYCPTCRANGKGATG
jgi:hypothetical protein